MRYKSNLEAPDLSAHFKLLDPPITIMGHDIPSDPDYDPGCGFFSNDEAAILYNVAKQAQGKWVDIGARFGWTTAHLIEAGCSVTQVDSAYQNISYWGRMDENMRHWAGKLYYSYGKTSSEVFAQLHEDERAAGFCIDGNHDSPEPLNDAMNAAKFAADGCVILLHDFWGSPIRDAANWLLDQGWNCRVYWTPNGVACLWRGLPDFVPPDHVRDPALEPAWENIRRDCEKDFDFGRTK